MPYPIFLYREISTCNQRECVCMQNLTHIGQQMAKVTNIVWEGNDMCIGPRGKKLADEKLCQMKVRQLMTSNTFLLSTVWSQV